MPRYFFKITYNGTNFSGWQNQPNAPTVQETIEKAFEKVLRQATPIVGCGRTDAGVHASKYFFHVDLEEGLDMDQLLFKLNHIVSKQIALQKYKLVDDEAHARFHAELRSYTYKIHFEKNPFLINKSFQYNHRIMPDMKVLNDVCALLESYEDFYPFCKSNSDVDHYMCKIFKMEWKETANGLEFNISANRFLRGMIRLIVGMSLNVGIGKIQLTDVVQALDKQERLKLSWSVPGQGLYLSDVQYPFIDPEF